MVSKRDEDAAVSRDTPLYTISIVAEMFDVHPQTLRLYEREGLIHPKRSQGNTRQYSQEDLDRLQVVLNLTRDMGVNLAGIDVVLRLRERMEALHHEFRKLIDFIRDELTSADSSLGARFDAALIRSPHRDLVLVGRDEAPPEEDETAPEVDGDSAAVD
ncbi:helix-turn-helix transcriptional regulator [bacterium]|nr:helix-turn-helix transcriptional regulator [candidate division CSSED10-310 bacterium]